MALPEGVGRPTSGISNPLVVASIIDITRIYSSCCMRVASAISAVDSIDDEGRDQEEQHQNGGHWPFLLMVGQPV
jgi:hypothetical protein